MRKDLSKGGIEGLLYMSVEKDKIVVT
jgi:hypothetical protein